MCKIYSCLLLLLLSVYSFGQTSEFSLHPFQDQEGRLGYKNASQQIMIEAQFEEAHPFSGNYAIVKKNSLWGIINSKGKWLIPASYEDLGWTKAADKAAIINGEYTGYKQKGKWGLVSVKNKIITPPLYDILMPLSNNKVKAGQVVSTSRTDTLLGVINFQGKEIIPLQYHLLEGTSVEGVLLAGVNKIYHYNTSGEIQGSTKAIGLISWANAILLPIEYKSISEHNEVFEVLPFNSWKVITDKDSIAAVSYALDSMFAVSAGMYAFANGGKMGLVEKTSAFHANKDAIYPEQKGFVLYQTQQKFGLGLPIGPGLQTFLQAKYDSIALDSKEFIRVGLRQDNRWQWQLIKREDNNASYITQQPYEQIELLSDQHLIKVKNKGLYGYLNEQGTEVIPIQYDSLGSFADSICVARYKGKYGILQQNGKWLFEPTADYFAVNSYGYFLRRKNGLFEIIDKAGKVKYSSTGALHFLPDGSVSLKQKGKSGRISPTGVLCVPAAYDSVSLMTAVRTFWAYSGKNVYLYNALGEMLLKQGNSLEKLVYVKDEFFPARINGKYGFVDGFGRLRIANQYEEVRPFEGQLAAVKLAGKWGFVTRSEKIAVQPYYDEVGSFINGKAIARKGNKYGIVDQQGKIVTPFSYDAIFPHLSGNYVTESRGKQGMLNQKGFEAIHAKYDEVQPQNDAKAIVKLNTKYGLMDSKGLIIVPIACDKIIKNPYSTEYLILNKAQPFTTDRGKFLSKAADTKK